MSTRIVLFYYHLLLTLIKMLFSFVDLDLCVYTRQSDWLLTLSLWVRVQLSDVGVNGILLNVQLCAALPCVSVFTSQSNITL